MTGSARYEADRDAGRGCLEPCFRSDELEGKLIIEMKTKRIGDCRPARRASRNPEAQLLRRHIAERGRKRRQ